MAGEDDGRKFGVVLFDDPQDPSSGWAAQVVDGRGASVRVGGIYELATDTLWWSNVSYDHFFKGRSETWRSPNLRHDKYLPVSHVDMLREWGHDPANVEADFVALFTGQLFDRVMRIAWSLLREASPKARMETTFQGKSLRDDLRTLLPELEYPKLEAAEVMRSGQAWEEFTTTGAKGPKGAKWYTLRKPRLSYAMEMLQTPVPRGPYRHCKKSEVGRNAADRVSHVTGMTTPAIVEVTVNKIQPEVAPIYGFGAATNRDQKVSRSWVAAPEFAVLARVADLDVRSMWEAEQYWPLVPSMPEAAREFLDDKYTDYSWSAGVVAEALWRAVSLGEDKGRAGPQRDGESRASTSWQGLWIRAADKSSMFGLSMRLGELGHAVVSYGLGWIRIQAGEEDLGTIIRDGMSMGLMPSLLDVTTANLKPGTVAPAWGGCKRSGALATMTIAREARMLWNLDRTPLLPFGERTDYIRGLQKARAGQVRKSA